MKKPASLAESIEVGTNGKGSLVIVWQPLAVRETPTNPHQLLQTYKTLRLAPTYLLYLNSQFLIQPTVYK